MSAPIGNREEWDKVDEALLYAPPWARQRRPEGGDVPRFTNSPPMAPGVGGPNIDPPPPRRFEGDVAAEALRRQLSLDPVAMPQPPFALRRSDGQPWLFRLWLMLMMAAVVTFCAIWLWSPDAKRQVASQSSTSSSNNAAPSPAAKPREAEPPRLLVEKQRGYANEPLALGVAVKGNASGETLLLQGLREGTRLSSGSPLGHNAWRLPAGDLGNVVAYAPQDFIGTMDARADLRSPSDRLMDSQFVTLEWMAKKTDRRFDVSRPQESTPAPIDSDEIAGLRKRAQEFLRSGDIASARLLLRRAANAGSADAALTLGATFDDDFLSELGVLGFAPNVEQARAWYQKAMQMGSAEASRRLNRLEGEAK